MVDPKVLELVDQKVLPEFPSDKKELGILAMLEIAAAILSIFQNCPNIKEQLEQDAEKVLRMLSHPNLFNKFRVYRTVRRQCKQHDTEQNFDTIVDAILKSGKKATKEDVMTLADAAAKLASPES